MPDPERTLDPDELLRHRGFVRALARSLTRDHHLADDLEQETLATAIARPPDRPDALRTWLARVLRHAASRSARGNDRRRRREAAAARPEIAPDWDPIGRLRWQRRLARAVLALPEPFRTAVILRHYEDLSPAGIARRLGVPSATVRTRVHRGLGLLRERLDDAAARERLGWRSALLALAAGPGALSGPGRIPLLGGVVVTRKLALATALLLTLTLGLVVTGILLRPPGSSPGDPGAPGIESMPVVPGGPVARDEGSPGTPVPGHASLDGTVWRGARPAAARVEIRRLSAVPDRGFDPFVFTRVSPAAPDGSPPLRAQAAEDGRFTATGLAPGTYRVRAVTPEGETGLSIAEIPLDGVRTGVRVVLPGGAVDLAGRVTWADGSPFRGSVILARSRVALEDGALVSETTANGGFRITGLLPGRWAVYLERPGVFTLSLPGIDLPTGGPVRWSAGLRIALAGRVVDDATGRPVPGATVRFGLAVATADSAGRFALSGGRRPATVQAAAPGFAPWFARVAKEGEAEIRLRSGASLSGRVLEEGTGRPAAEAVVVTDRRGAAAVAGPDGRFRLEGLAPGEIGLRVAGGGYVSPELARLDGVFDPLRFPVPPEGEVRLEAVRAGAVAGRVLDETGDGTPGATVRVHALAVGLPDPSVAVTDASGKYRIPALVRGVAYSITAEAAGRLPASTGPIRLAAEDELRVDLRPGPGGAVLATVRDGDTGEPCPGVRVSAAATASPRSRPRAWTDQEGRALLAGLPPGTVTVFGERDGWRKAEPARVEVTAGPSPARVEISLSRGLSLSGKLLVVDGGPVTEGWVYWRGEEEGPRGGVRVGPDGSFLIRALRPGRVRLRFRGTGNGPVEGGLELGTVKAGDQGLVFRIERSDLPVSQSVVVRVVDPEGCPVPSIHLTLRVVRDKSEESESGEVSGERYVQEMVQGVRSITVTATRAARADGTPLPLGPATWGPGPVPDGEIVLRLRPGRVVTGRVVGPDGSGFRGVRVDVEVPSGNRGVGPAHVDQGRTDTDGGFRLVRLGPGPALLRVSPPPGYRDPGPVPVPEGDRPVTIRLEAGIDATVTFRDEAGEPVAGARVSASIPGDRVKAVTDQAGRAVLPGLEPDSRYELSVVAPPSLGLAPFRVDDWSPADGAFVLARVRVLTGCVRGPDGDGAAGAEVDWRRSGSTDRYDSVAADATGRFSIPDLPSGRIELRARPAGTSPDTELAGPVREEAAGAENVVLMVPASATVHVRCEGWPAGGSARARVRIRRRGTTARPGAGSRDGVFAVGGLVPGATYDLVVGPVGDGLVGQATGVVARDGITVPIRMAPGREITGRIVLEEGAGRPSVLVWCEALAEGWRPARVARDGTFTVKGLPDLPDLTFEVRAWVRGGETHLADREPATPGTPVLLHPVAH